MAVKRIEGSIDVVEAAKRRLKNVFSNGCKVYLAFSGGKDTLCMCGLIYELAERGEIDPHLLTVVFIDEESLYDSMFQMAIRWRKRFLAMGAEFRWYCLPLCQVSMLHHLADDESWITWEPGKWWIRQPPPFAITRDPNLKYPGQMRYQQFLPLVTKDGVMLVGVRASESVQRLKYLSTVEMVKGQMTGNNIIYPIYDWKDSDVWLYIKEKHLDFPDAYIDLYRAGVPKHQLRLCNFFASESIAGLRYIAETDPKLWDAIQKREPNAYLALLYWDSEMFHRSTVKRRKLEEKEEQKDYKALMTKLLFEDFDETFTTPERREVARAYKKLYIKGYSFMTQRHYKKMYEALKAGDPKKRSLRAIYTDIFVDYTKYAKNTDSSRGGGERNG